MYGKSSARYLLQTFSLSENAKALFELLYPPGIFFLLCEKKISWLFNRIWFVMNLKISSCLKNKSILLVKMSIILIKSL